ncbi:MAG: sulfurtransferase TusA [Pseudomonadales bacterium]|nr:sulfurtransferase TusA [Pseudomonadales bacterium]MCP5186592.1 sulfurtransferase TusA [Pseudomonadales bacterium]
MTSDLLTMNPEADHILDATGLYCPEPVMLLHKRIAEIAAGDTLLVLSTDPASLRDVPKFCHFLGHDLLCQDEADGHYRFLLRKAAGETEAPG